jgi:hypothetical protein
MSRIKGPWQNDLALFQAGERKESRIDSFITAEIQT